MTKNKKKSQYVICIRDEGSEDLIPGKVYQALDDEAAAREDYLRVIDESGEDYLYPASYFIPVALPQAAQQALFSTNAPPSSM